MACLDGGESTFALAGSIISALLRGLVFVCVNAPVRSLGLQVNQIRILGVAFAEWSSIFREYAAA